MIRFRTKDKRILEALQDKEKPLTAKEIGELTGMTAWVVSGRIACRLKNYIMQDDPPMWKIHRYQLKKTAELLGKRRDR